MSNTEGGTIVTDSTQTYGPTSQPPGNCAGIAAATADGADIESSKAATTTTTAMCEAGKVEASSSLHRWQPHPPFKDIPETLLYLLAKYVHPTTCAAAALTTDGKPSPVQTGAFGTDADAAARAAPCHDHIKVEKEAHQKNASSPEPPSFSSSSSRKARVRCAERQIRRGQAQLLYAIQRDRERELRLRCQSGLTPQEKGEEKDTKVANITTSLMSSSLPCDVACSSLVSDEEAEHALTGFLTTRLTLSLAPWTHSTHTSQPQVQCACSLNHFFFNENSSSHSSLFLSPPSIQQQSQQPSSLLLALSPLHLRPSRDAYMEQQRHAGALHFMLCHYGEDATKCMSFALGLYRHLLLLKATPPPDLSLWENTAANPIRNLPQNVPCSASSSSPAGMSSFGKHEGDSSGGGGYVREGEAVVPSSLSFSAPPATCGGASFEVDPDGCERPVCRCCCACGCVRNGRVMDDANYRFHVFYYSRHNQNGEGEDDGGAKTEEKHKEKCRSETNRAGTGHCKGQPHTRRRRRSKPCQHNTNVLHLPFLALQLLADFMMAITDKCERVRWWQREDNRCPASRSDTVPQTGRAAVSEKEDDETGSEHKEGCRCPCCFYEYDVDEGAETGTAELCERNGCGDAEKVEGIDLRHHQDKPTRACERCAAYQGFFSTRDRGLVIVACALLAWKQLDGDAAGFALRLGTAAASAHVRQRPSLRHLTDLRYHDHLHYEYRPPHPHPQERRDFDRTSQQEQQQQRHDAFTIFRLGSALGGASASAPKNEGPLDCLTDALHEAGSGRATYAFEVREVVDMEVYIFKTLRCGDVAQLPLWWRVATEVTQLYYNDDLRTAARSRSRLEREVERRRGLETEKIFGSCPEMQQKWQEEEELVSEVYHSALQQLLLISLDVLLLPMLLLHGSGRHTRAITEANATATPYERVLASCAVHMGCHPLLGVAVAVLSGAVPLRWATCLVAPRAPMVCAAMPSTTFHTSTVKHTNKKGDEATAAAACRCVDSCSAISHTILQQQREQETADEQAQRALQAVIEEVRDWLAAGEAA